jgi:hypothetical protein
MLAMLPVTSQISWSSLTVVDGGQSLDARHSFALFEEDGLLAAL